MTIMRKIFALLALAVCFSATAQIKSPKPSPTANLTQTVGMVDITINYSRPGLKGRTIFGDLVPYDAVWRTGANHCTTIEFAEEVTFDGNAVPAGKYGLYTIPGKEKWTVIISKQNDLWGTSGYDEAQDVVRFEVEPYTIEEPIESLTIEFDGFTDNGATLYLMWDKTVIMMPITVDTDAMMEAQIKKYLIDGTEEVDAGSYHSAALYYHEKGIDDKKALEWMNKSIELRPDAFFYIYRKAEMLADMGETKEAIKTAEKSLEMAKANPDGDFGYAARNEALIAKLKEKKKK